MTDTTKTLGAQQEQLANAVSFAMTAPKVSGFVGAKLPDLSGLKGQVEEQLDKVIAAVDTVLEFKWLIPDKLEAPIQAFSDGLHKVKGWINR